MQLLEQLVENSEQIEMTFQEKDDNLKSKCENIFGLINHLKRTNSDIDTNIDQIKENMNNTHEGINKIMSNKIYDSPNSNVNRISRLDRTRER